MIEPGSTDRAPRRRWSCLVALSVILTSAVVAIGAGYAFILLVRDLVT